MFDVSRGLVVCTFACLASAACSGDDGGGGSDAQVDTGDASSDAGDTTGTPDVDAGDDTGTDAAEDSATDAADDTQPDGTTDDTADAGVDVAEDASGDTDGGGTVSECEISPAMGQNGVTFFRVSPNGRYVAWARVDEGTTPIVVRDLDTGADTVVGADYSFYPSDDFDSFSPTSEWAMWTNGPMRIAARVDGSAYPTQIENVQVIQWLPPDDGGDRLLILNGGQLRTQRPDNTGVVVLYDNTGYPDEPLFHGDVPERLTNVELMHDGLYDRIALTPDGTRAVVSQGHVALLVVPLNGADPVLRIENVWGFWHRGVHNDFVVGTPASGDTDAVAAWSLETGELLYTVSDDLGTFGDVLDTSVYSNRMEDFVWNLWRLPLEASPERELISTDFQRIWHDPGQDRIWFTARPSGVDRLYQYVPDSEVLDIMEVDLAEAARTFEQWWPHYHAGLNRIYAAGVDMELREISLTDGTTRVVEAGLINSGPDRVLFSDDARWVAYTELSEPVEIHFAPTAGGDPVTAPQTSADLLDFKSIPTRNALLYGERIGEEGGFRIHRLVCVPFPE